ERKGLFRVGRLGARHLIDQRMIAHSPQDEVAVIKGKQTWPTREVDLQYSAGEAGDSVVEAPPSTRVRLGAAEEILDRSLGQALQRDARLPVVAQEGRCNADRESRCHS